MHTVLNVASLVPSWSRLRPGNEAVVFESRRITWRELDALTARVAGALVSLGVRPGDHVALSCPNLPYFPIAYFGILRAGAVVVPLNVLLKPREIAYHLRDSDARVYFCFEGTPELPMLAMAREALADAPDCAHLIALPCDPGATSTVHDVPTLNTLLAGATPVAEVAPTRPDDTAVILYTSGTTGQPKGAELSHLNLWCNALGIANLAGDHVRRGTDGRNVSLVTLPLFHSFGQTCQMIQSAVFGGTIVLLPVFDPRKVLETMQREQVNFWSAVPTMFWTLLNYAQANGVDTAPIAKSLRMTLSGGAPMPVEVMKRFEDTFGVRVLEGYGLSETSPVATFNHLDVPSKPGTVGQAIAGVEVAVVDAQDRPVPAGEVGEVVIRGHNIMKGYYKRPEATADAMRNGWFHSGDMGVLDDEGYLSIVDRKKDMIIRGGFNVYPRELEEVLMTHPAVSLCAVVGVPDERLGEEVKACIVRAPGATVTEAEIIEWCRGQFAAYKYPRAVEFLEKLPTGPTGKILKRELRQKQKTA